MIRAVTVSLSARRAWIEIPAETDKYCRYSVALRKESVDRNMVFANADCEKIAVALRKESVDRNALMKIDMANSFVALRKESVDRNFVVR